MLHNCFHSRTKKYGCANLLYQWNSSLSKITPPHYWSFQHSSYIKTNLSIWLLSISLNSQWKQIKIELSGNCTIIMENPQAWKKIRPYYLFLLWWCCTVKISFAFHSHKETNFSVLQSAKHFGPRPEKHLNARLTFSSWAWSNFSGIVHAWLGPEHSLPCRTTSLPRTNLASGDDPPKPLSTRWRWRGCSTWDCSRQELLLPPCAAEG